MTTNGSNKHQRESQLNARTPTMKAKSLLDGTYSRQWIYFVCIPWDVTKFHSCLNVTDFRVQLPNSMENVCCSYSCFCIRTFSSAAVVWISACLQFQPQPWDIPLRDCKRKSENYNLDSYSIWSFPYLLFHAPLPLSLILLLPAKHIFMSNFNNMSKP